MNRHSLSSDHKKLISYSVGFILSIFFTILAYSFAVNDGLREYWSVTTIMLLLASLALIQLIVQLVFFMHLADENRPRWKLYTFIIMFFILAIIVLGSLWIMFDLNSRMMMTPEQMMKYMNRQTGI